MDQSNWNIIIVDDEKDNVGVMQMVFEFNDIKVRGANSGNECLALLEQDAPSFMLVDIQMPEMSGYDLLKHIRKNEQWRGIPIIAVTAHARQEDEHEIMEAGFDGYIAKPISVMTLMDQVTQIPQSKASS